MKEVTPKDIFNLLKKIWPNKPKIGWVYLKNLFGDTRLEGATQETLDQMYDCLESYVSGEVCIIHDRVHTEKYKDKIKKI